MKKFLALPLVLALGACMYGNPVNYERHFGNADITAIDWTVVDGQGSACQYNWLGFIPTGNRSVARAVEHGDLARIKFIDTDTIVMFPLFIAECTNVWGIRTDEARIREERIRVEREARRANNRLFGHGSQPPLTLSDMTDE